MSASLARHPVLLDTCAVIWFAEGKLPAPARDWIALAAASGDVHVSVVSAWEIGLLARPRPGRPILRLLPDAKTYFADLVSGPAIRVAALTPTIAIDASFLPGDLHNDPADRLLIATARELGIPIVTGDRKIIAYGAAGFVRVIEC